MSHPSTVPVLYNTHDKGRGEGGDSFDYYWLFTANLSWGSPTTCTPDRSGDKMWGGSEPSEQHNRGFLPGSGDSHDNA